MFMLVRELVLVLAVESLYVELVCIVCVCVCVRVFYDYVYTVELLYQDTLELRTPL